MKTEALKRLTRDDTEHCFEYYLADEVDAALLAEKLASAQRTWVGLTPQDYADIFKVARTGEHAVQLAEKILRENNVEK
jgi:hypothetical protein